MAIYIINDRFSSGPMNGPIIERMREAAGDLWEQATTHPSAGEDHYQRLEFLGNGALNLALVDLLYHHCPEREGELTMMCNHLRSEEVLNDVGRQMGLAAYLKHVPNKDGRLVDSIVAGGLEAVIGAIYERAGYEVAKGFVEECLLTDALLTQARDCPDPISVVREIFKKSPWKPKLQEFDEAVGDSRVFYYSIEMGNRAVLGMGPSKKKAEAQASRLYLSLVKGER
jgi:ribonuclease-3